MQTKNKLIEQQLQQLFGDYFKAFQVQNIAQVLACYQVPCLLITPDRLVNILSKEDAEQEFKQIFLGINQAGITSFKALSADYIILNEEEGSDDLIAVNIRWQFLNNVQEIIGDFYALYHIVKKRQQLKIFQVLSHEIEASTPFPHPLNLTKAVTT